MPQPTSRIYLALDKRCPCRNQAACEHDYVVSLRGMLHLDNLPMTKGAVGTLCDALDVLQDTKAVVVRDVAVEKLPRVIAPVGRAS